MDFRTFIIFTGQGDIRYVGFLIFLSEFNNFCGPLFIMCCLGDFYNTYDFYNTNDIYLKNSKITPKKDPQK